MAKIRVDGIHAQILESLTQAAQPAAQVTPIHNAAGQVVGAIAAGQDAVPLIDGNAALEAAQVQGPARLAGGVLGLVSDPGALIAQMNPELLAPGNDLARLHSNRSRLATNSNHRVRY